MILMRPLPLDQEDEEMLAPRSDLVEGLQPMEVAPVEPASTVDSQQVEDPPPMKFTWKIENFARLNIKKHYSEIFVVGGYKWRILIFPKGNNVEYLSMYLDVADSGTLPYGWSRYAQFSLTVVNQIHSKYTMRKDTEHQFNARESDWGFTSFIPLSDLCDPSRGYLVNDTVVVEAEVAVLQIRLKKEQEEKEDTRRYKAQAHLYTIIKVARDEDLAEQIGRDIYFDLVDHDKVHSFRIQKRTPFNLFKEEVAKEFGIPVQLQRFWIWAKRQNHTYRPNRPLTPQEESQSVGQLREVSKKIHNAELKLFLEVELGPDQRPIPPPDKTKEDILLFFKLYEPDKRKLRFVGRLFVKSSSMPIEILAKLNQMAGFAPKEEIELYEEIKFVPCIMCEHVDKRTSFRSSQIEDGDIICFQKSTPLESEECKYPDVPSFMEYVHNRQGLGWSESDLEVIGQASDSQNDPALSPAAMEELFDHFQCQTVTEEETSLVFPQDLPPSADVAAATEDLSPASRAKLLIHSWISDCQHQVCSPSQLDEAIEAVGLLVTEGVLDDDGGSILSESIRSYNFQQARAVQAQEEASQAQESLQTLAAARSTRDRAVQASILKTDELRAVDERIADLEARLQAERAVRAKFSEDLNGFSTEVHSLDGTIQDLEARGSAFDMAIQAGQRSVVRLDLAYKHLKLDFDHVF